MENSQSFFDKRSLLDGKIVETQYLLKSSELTNKEELSETIDKIDDASADCSSTFKRILVIFKEHENDSDVAPIIAERLIACEKTMDELITQIDDVHKHIVEQMNAINRDRPKDESTKPEETKAETSDKDIKVEDKTKTEDSKDEPKSEPEEAEAKRLAEIEVRKNQKDAEAALKNREEIREEKTAKAKKDEQPFWSIIFAIVFGLLTALTWHNHDFNNPDINASWVAWLAGFVATACYLLAFLLTSYIVSYFVTNSHEASTTSAKAETPK